MYRNILQLTSSKPKGGVFFPTIIYTQQLFAMQQIFYPLAMFVNNKSH